MRSTGLAGAGAVCFDAAPGAGWGGAGMTRDEIILICTCDLGGQMRGKGFPASDHRAVWIDVALPGHQGGNN